MEIRKMNQHEAIEISNWHYEGVYKFYNLEEDLEDFDEFMNEETRQTTFSVYEDSKLIGFFSYQKIDHEISIGLGLKPELTGKGKGEGFLNHIIEFIKSNLLFESITLEVACFNERAIKAYQKVGFIPINVYKQKTNGSVYDYLHMEYKFK